MIVHVGNPPVSATNNLMQGILLTQSFGIFVLYGAADKAVSLAPAYDIVTTTPHIKGDSLALPLEGSKSFPKAKRLLNFAKLQCNLQPAKTTSILEEVAEAVVKTMGELRRYAKDHPDFEKIGEAMLKERNDGINSMCKLESSKAAIPSTHQQ